MYAQRRVGWMFFWTGCVAMLSLAACNDEPKKDPRFEVGRAVLREMDKALASAEKERFLKCFACSHEWERVLVKAYYERLQAYLAYRSAVVRVYGVEGWRQYRKEIPLGVSAPSPGWSEQVRIYDDPKYGRLFIDLFSGGVLRMVKEDGDWKIDCDIAPSVEGMNEGEAKVLTRHCQETAAALLAATVDIRDPSISFTRLHEMLVQKKNEAFYGVLTRPVPEKGPAGKRSGSCSVQNGPICRYRVTCHGR